MKVSKPRANGEVIGEVGQPTIKRANAYRKGRFGHSIYLPEDAQDAIEQAVFDLRKVRGVRMTKTEIIEEALDDWFEKHGHPRHMAAQKKQNRRG